MKTCRLVTLGCKVNQYETQLVREALERQGYREAQDEEVAELCVVNTCTVTSNGDSRSRQVIRQLAKQNPGTRTLVMGCYATRDPDAVAKLPSVAEVITDKRELPDILARHGIYDDLPGISRFPGRKRAYVKLQDGCILRCSYCIIPQVRPGLHSRSPEEIEAEVRRLLDSGHQELILTGIHIGHYGVDTSRGRSGKPPFRLWHLIQRLDRIPGPWRMRLSSIEAAEIDNDFVAAAADTEHLCPHFHPALQSGSTTVLRRMRRRYTAEKFLSSVETLKARLNEPGLTTDIIVGFPGETDVEFRQTVATCQQAGFHKLHIFPFSPRKGTPAADYAEQVPGEVVNSRVNELQRVEAELAGRYHERLIGRTLQVLVEGVAPDQPGMVLGTDERYATVLFPGSDLDANRLISVRAISATSQCVYAERIDETPAVREGGEQCRLMNSSQPLSP
ncbi:tRNA (N(6)-L-threonylcarbamoyladenosine(37)-C(2))-methylthiotransferase MtaB [bacterium]|nr:tRNA (N(6)-L-threonylcarbamoyladenosine(37)-C(2))-methylthiotransferase MtaB [bacterium]